MEAVKEIAKQSMKLKLLHVGEYLTHFMSPTGKHLQKTLGYIISALLFQCYIFLMADRTFVEIKRRIIG